MKTKHLSKEETLSLIERTQNIIDFNNRLNKVARDYIKKYYASGAPRFNGYHDSPTTEMLELLRDMLSKEEWMPATLRNTYIRDTSGIFGGTYSIAVNTYHRTDLKDLENHLKELELASEKTEEVYDELDFTVERDIEDTRLNLHFNSVPEKAVRELLVKNGFKWSPTRSAWTRQLTPNAEKSLERLISQLKDYHGTEM